MAEKWYTDLLTKVTLVNSPHQGGKGFLPHLKHQSSLKDWMFHLRSWDQDCLAKFSSRFYEGIRGAVAPSYPRFDSEPSLAFDGHFPSEIFDD